MITGNSIVKRDTDACDRDAQIKSVVKTEQRRQCKGGELKIVRVSGIKKIKKE